MSRAERTTRVRLTEYIPVQGDRVRVGFGSDAFLLGPEVTWVRDSAGRSLSGSLCALDKLLLPKTNEFENETLEIVADAETRWGYVMIAIGWRSDCDLEFLVSLEHSFAQFDYPDRPEKALAQARRKRLLGGIAAAMGHVVLPSKYSWQHARLPPLVAREILLKEAEVWLDCMLDFSEWSESFCETVTPQGIYRDWPRMRSLDLDMMDRLGDIVNLADLAGKKAGAGYDGSNTYFPAARMLIPPWSLDGLREELSLALQLKL